jgi:hypothetical protein
MKVGKTLLLPYATLVVQCKKLCQSSGPLQLETTLGGDYPQLATREKLCIHAVK